MAVRQISRESPRGAGAGLIHLLFSVLCSVLIGNLLMLFNRDKNIDILVVFIGNYFVAAAVSLSSARLSTHPSISLPEFALAIFAGALFLYNFFVYHANIRINGLSLSVGVMRSAVIIPTLFSALIFGDLLKGSTAFGIGILILAFWILTGKQKLHNFIWIGLLFLITGATDISLKLFSHYGKAPQGLYLCFLFSSAFLCTLIWFLFTRRKPPLKSLLYGFVLGIPNQLSSLFFLKGLDSVPATIAFPLVSSGIVSFSIISDAILWKKRFSLSHYIALSLLILGIVLINLR